MEIRPNPVLNSHLFAISWAIYILFLMPYADQVTDECSATPGHNFTNAIFIVPIYFALFGYWIFQIFMHLAKHLRLLISCLLLLLLPILLALIMNSIALSSGTIDLINEINLFKMLYKYGCYQELEVNSSALISVIALVIGLILYRMLTILNNTKFLANRK